MAPAITSNPFRLSTAPFRPQPTVICRSGLGNSKDAAADDAGEPKKKAFFVDFGKLPDPKSLIPAVTSPSTSLLAGRRRKDPQTVFVAGATGQGGVRIAQTLLRQGFTVRAGVPDLASAQELARIAATYKVISPAEAKRLNAVQSVYEDPEAIAKSIGPATKVVVTIGPAEKGPTAEVTTDDALRVVQAADLAGVGHVVVVYDAGAGIGSGSTYNVLDGITLFFSNLFSRTQPLSLSDFLAKVAETDVSYTLVRATLTEDYSPESSYGLVVAQEGTAAATTTESGKVCKSQIATLVADVFSNMTVAENKVVEVSTSPSATSKPIAEAFIAIPEDTRRKEYQEALAKAKAEEAALASQKAREAAKAGTKLEADEGRKLSEEKPATASIVNEARERASASLENLMSRAKGLRGELSWEKLSSQLPAAQNSDDGKPKAQIATVRGQAKAKRLPPQKAVVKQQEASKKAKARQPDPTKPEVRSVFGLFKQETIYMDE